MTKHLNVLVTGASSGIGRAAALEFASRGHQVFAAARREQALATLTTARPDIRAVTLDVTDADSVERAWAKISASTGGAGVDVLVNNAGFALPGPIEVLADADVRRQFATNVFGLLTMTRTVLPSMRTRGSGRVINVSSLVGRTTFPGMGVYGATKYAVEALSDALRQEVAGFGIKVVIIEPGFVATSLGEAADGRRTGHEETSGFGIHVIIIEPGFVATSLGEAADALPAEQRETTGAYAEMMARGSRYLAAQIAKGTAPERVAAAIVSAAEHPSPRSRYVVPGSARALIALLTTLPARLSDRVKQRAIASA
jgi:NAD(P)-dependent dehydrogenase (short-subunit alcohol dehydrogenase family)